MRIGPVSIPTPLILAPMAGVTDIAFRAICRELGAGYTLTEMVSAKALCYQDKKTIPLMELGPEEHPAGVQVFGSDPVCMEEAAAIIREQGLADVTLFGKPEKIAAIAAKFNANIDGIDIIDPENHELYPAYVDKFYEMRKAKGVTPEKAAVTMKDPLFFAAMMVKDKKADGFVSGAINTTGNTLRPGLQIVKMRPGIKTISSFFIMQVKDKSYGEDGTILFGDCAINIDPDADQLAEIALCTAENAKVLLDFKEPRVAMLSFSTRGSAKHENVDKVAAATAKVKELNPNLCVDGEMQADAALVAKVGNLKCPGSNVAGKANILIFPDLQSGNIGYKLVQRLGGAEAIGPVSQGFAAPINDLSRGCSIEDIVSLVAITAVQAQGMKAEAK